ncbi:MAG: dihydrofolate reductase [Bacteroidales bacterium]|nr:dihydrofolate reductase [Bacteroidales bacterium]
MIEKCIIVAVADNWAIGRKNALLWNLPGDMKYFREQTTGHPVIMGWMTFQSIGRPLPRRKNIVISIFPWPEAPEKVTVVTSLEEAYAAAEASVKDAGEGRCFVIGGAYTYAEAMETADKLFITHVHDVVEDADAFFPEIDPLVWEEESRSETQTDPDTGVTYEFTVYKRR